MKNYIIIFVILFSSYSFAGPGHSGGGGIGTDPNIQMKTMSANDIAAITTRSGDYARIEDLKESFVKFHGIKIDGDKMFISSEDIYSIIKTNGAEFRIK